MMRNTYLLLLAIILINCSDNTTQNNEEQKVKDNKSVKKAPQVKPAPKIDTNRITDENVEKKLMAFGAKNPETIVKIYTSKGMIKARLYKDTPLHRANFIMLAKKGFFDHSMFTRVARNFIAQGGSAYDEANYEVRKNLGKYTLPAEIRPHHFHKQGAIGAARRYEENPDKRSNPSAFYFVEGNFFNEATLDKYEENNGYRYSKAQREYYLNNQGSAHIDGQHTIFGEVISGYSVVPKITSVATDSKDWPLEDIFIDSVVVVR